MRGRSSGQSSTPRAREVPRRPMREYSDAAVQSAAGPRAGSGEPRLRGITITHPERIIDQQSGCTKLDLARYCDAVAPFILPYLQARPVYLLRSPTGVAGKAFFQRHATRSAIPGIDRVDRAVDPDHQPLMVINTAPALVSAAQMGSIELHSCNARADLIDKPDRMVLDLDPDPSLAWEEIAEGARLAKRLLDDLGLICFLKTSGSKGLHLVVPLARHHAWKMVTAFSAAVADRLARACPRRFSATMGEQNRVGKIYIDYLRNQKMASTVAPFSARARSGLPVSAPLVWDELDDIAGSAMWTIRTLPDRLAALKKDPWADFPAKPQRLTKTMQQALGVP